MGLYSDLFDKARFLALQYVWKQGPKVKNWAIETRVLVFDHDSDKSLWGAFVDVLTPDIFPAFFEFEFLLEDGLLHVVSYRPCDVNPYLTGETSA